MRGRTILSEGMGMPLLDVRYPQLDNHQRALKRALDVAVSAVGLLLLAPLFLVAALAVRLDSPGPVLFRQKRRSEEHTSELQSRQYLVCRLLLEKKKNIK